MDSVSNDLHREGIGAERKSAGVITPEDEDKMWEDGALGLSPPKVLQHTVFFYMRLQFLLRGVQEQHMLVPAQLVHVREPHDMAVYHSKVYYRYTIYFQEQPASFQRYQPPEHSRPCFCSTRFFQMCGKTS